MDNAREIPKLTPFPIPKAMKRQNQNTKTLLEFFKKKRGNADECSSSDYGDKSTPPVPASITSNPVIPTSNISLTSSGATISPSTSLSKFSASSESDKKMPSSSTVHPACRKAMSSLFASTSTFLHQRQICIENNCTNISEADRERFTGKDKFNHRWISEQSLAFCEESGFWWLVYEEGQGMFCLLCKKQNESNLQNKTKTYNEIPAKRFKKSAIEEHSKSAQHRAAIQKEMISRVSVFHKEYEEKKRVGEEVITQAFMAAYWLMKEEVSLSKMVSLLKLTEEMGLTTVKYFNHKSQGSLQEIFLSIGKTIKDQIVEKIQSARAFGILLDEVTDISVKNQMVLFIQYVNNATNRAEVSFFAVEDVLESSISANSATLHSVVMKILDSLGDDKSKLSSIVTDGANVMTGKLNGLVARLRNDFPSLVSVHCICHRLALACVTSNADIVYMKDVSDYLRQMWKFFEDSPKRSATLVKVQLELANCTTELLKTQRKSVTHKVRKACQTRWLSFDQAVSGFHSDVISIFTCLKSLDKDATAGGLLKKMNTVRFICAIYILRKVLPILAILSRTFQQGTINFANIRPSISAACDNLDDLIRTNSPVEDLKEDLGANGRLSQLEMNPTKYQLNQMENLLAKYVLALKENISNRFDHVTPLLAAFTIFDPHSVPLREEVTFRNYGQDGIKVIGDHFGYIEDTRLALSAEWAQFKYHMEQMKKTLPNELPVTPTEFVLQRLLELQTPHGQSFPLLCRIAEIILSMPVSNAWPERGASTVKRVKTRLRNRLNNRMMEAVMHVSMNGPQVHTNKGKDLVKRAVATWYQTKNRRHLPNPPSLNLTNVAKENEAEQEAIRAREELGLMKARFLEVISVLKLGRDAKCPESDYSSDDEGDEYDEEYDYSKV